MFRQEALDAQHAGALGEIVLTRPVSFTFLILLAAAMVLLVVGFFLLGSYTKRSTVSGQLVPASGQVKVHAPQAGTVLCRFVQEGQAVRRGEYPMVLSSERYGNDAGPVQAGISRRLEQRHDSPRGELGKFHHLQDDERDSLTSKVASLQRELTTLAAQTDSQQRLLALASDVVACYQGLMDKGYISMDQLQQRQAKLLGQRQTLQDLEREHTSLQQQLTERRNELVGLLTRQVNQLAETRRRLSAVEQDLAESKIKHTLLVTVPESGIATAVPAEVGQIVSSSRPLLNTVPADTPLQAELYAPSKSVGFIRPGDAVLICYQVYPYQKFGQYHDKVQLVSRASVSYAELSSIVGDVSGLGQDGEQLYRLWVTLDDQAVTAYGQPRPLQSGILLDADVPQDTRRLYEWVLEPLYSLTGKLQERPMASLDAPVLCLGHRPPLVLQTGATEYGLACLVMIAGYHGHHIGPMELYRRFSVSPKGISLKQPIQTVHRLGLDTRVVKLDPGDLGKLKLPYVLHWNFNHFVVFKAVDGRGAVLHDPAHGQRRLGLEEVPRGFTGVALELWPESGFKKREAPSRIKLLGILGKVTGLYRPLAQVLLLAGALEVSSLISPFFPQWTIDDVTVSENRDLLSTLAIGFSLLLLMQQAANGVCAWAMIYMSTLLGVQWQASVFSHLLWLPAQYFEKCHLGDVVSCFGAVNSIQQILTAAFPSAVLDGLMTVATLGMVLLHSPSPAAIAAAAMGLYALGHWIWYRPLCNATEEQIIYAARQRNHFLEATHGIRPLKLFQRRDECRSVWLGLLVERINAGLRIQKLQLFYQQPNGLLFGVGSPLVTWLGATIAMGGQFSVGILMTLNACKPQFDSRVGSSIDKFFELRMLQLQGGCLTDIVLRVPEVSHGDILPGNLRKREASIEIQGLRYRYAEQEPWVLDGLDLHIAGGESVVIIDSSGYGKSTLFNILLGILPPVEGQIRMADLDLAQLGLDDLCELVGTVLQDDVLFVGSLSNNISFFDPQSDMPWLLQCAQTAAIHDDIQAIPTGHNILVGDMDTVFPGGRKQRVMLARVLYKRPRILSLDEATSHLDVHCEQRVNAAICVLRVIRIMVAHQPRTTASADRVIVLGQGKVSLDESTARLAKRQAATAREQT